MDASALLAIGHLAAASAIAAMLAAGALAKLAARDDWLVALAGYRLVPGPLMGGVAALLPAAELAVAILIVTGLGGAAGVIAGAGLLLAFAAAIAVNLLRGRRHIDCGCDPRGRPRPIGWPMVARNVALAGILLGGIAAGPGAGLPARLLAIMAGAGVYALFRAIAILHSFAPRSTGAPNGAY
ncbi:MauE/DoxX family redox-associated membrane protein [Sphingomonas fennica]|uniref:Methylamine utilization protein MauE n=1 Tax=Edaphosphingomonas fennica TaxID=114404 RepID=A0A2T4HNI0_9SPHN|nr:MauE/DoxX family redox-associated membrane protein [Sphingomonas fennica]PTD17338.1 methylamine utilization protein MauE [Sphingomonas fennica]